MKTKIALIFSNIILLSLLLVSWNDKETKPQQEINCNNPDGVSFIPENTARLLAKNYFESLNNTKNISTINVSDLNLSKIKIDALKRNINLLKEISFEDSRSSWFSYKEIEKYLCIIKDDYKRVHGSDDPDLEKFGIRIYYGRYPNFNGNLRARGLDDLNGKYKNKHCLFFVPTYDNYTTYHQDDIRTINYTSSEEGGKNTITIQSSNILLSGSEKNHGNLVPPESFEGSRFYDINGNPQ